MKNVKIRQAKEEDTATIAKLIYYTEVVPEEVWGGSTKEECISNIEVLIKTKESKYSFEYITVAEVSNKVVGAIVLIPYNELERLNINTDLKVIHNFKGIKEKIYFIMDCIKLMICKECKKGDLYIANIATSASVRGMGVGKLLMDYAEKVAQKDDYYGISLLAKDEEVSEFYKKLNYKTIFDKVFLGERIIRMAKFV